MEKSRYKVKGHGLVGWFELSVMEEIVIAFNEEQAKRLAEMYIPQIYEVKQIDKANDDQDLGLVDGSKKRIGDSTEFLERYYGDSLS